MIQNATCREANRHRHLILAQRSSASHQPTSSNPALKRTTAGEPPTQSWTGWWELSEGQDRGHWAACISVCRRREQTGTAGVTSQRGEGSGNPLTGPGRCAGGLLGGAGVQLEAIVRAHQSQRSPHSARPAAVQRGPPWQSTRRQQIEDALPILTAEYEEQQGHPTAVDHLDRTAEPAGRTDPAQPGEHTGRDR